ncbi:MAG TPA: hypothetical protein ENN38_07085 [Actinobacteria bacterium]|nr:hypothetical protein [Actinomycetota bacterium]
MRENIIKTDIGGKVEEKKKITEEPKLEDIIAELKVMGAQLKDAFKTTVESEKAKKMRAQVADGFDSLTDAFDKFIKDAKSGQLEKDIKKGLRDSIKVINEKLKQYSEARKEEE